MSDMRQVLLPCPFCGGNAEFGSVDDAADANCGGDFIQCSNLRCEASSALIFPLKEDARPLLLERWNRRASLAEGDPPETAVTELDRMCAAYLRQEQRYDLSPITWEQLSEDNRNDYRRCLQAALTAKGPA